MTEAHGSRSDEQVEAESLMIAEVSRQMGRELRRGKVAIGGGASVQPDGMDSERTVFVEVYARQGKLAAGQLKKVAQDILKFSVLRADYPQADLVLVFASPEALESIRGWVLIAAERHGVRLIHVPLPVEVSDRIVKAQDRQREGMKLTAQVSPEIAVQDLDEAML